MPPDKIVRLPGAVQTEEQPVDGIYDLPFQVVSVREHPELEPHLLDSGQYVFEFVVQGAFSAGDGYGPDSGVFGYIQNCAYVGIIRIFGIRTALIAVLAAKVAAMRYDQIEMRLHESSPTSSDHGTYL